MTDIQQNNMAMYQDILMKLSQQQHVPGLNGASMPPRTPPNAASLMAAAASGNHNLLQNNQNSMHLLQQLREAANRSRTYGSVGQQSDKNSEKNSERASPQSSTQSTSNPSALALALVQDANKNQFKTQDPPKTPRRNDQKEQHKCPKCDYTTPWKSSIATHMKLKHSNERPWRCDICGKAYKLKHHLKAHMEGSHASEKPYQCKLCVFSCIDSRTLNKHMFNKHGRQTPIKTNQMMNGRSPSNLSSMIPSLIGQRGHPMGRDPVGLGNPFLLNHNRNLINLKAQEQMQETLRNRFSALSAAAQASGQSPNFEQIQFLQEQMAAQLAAQAKNQNQENFPKVPSMEFPSDSPFPNAPNTALLAQIAAQMQRIQAQNAQNSAQNTSTGQNSHNTTPEDESLEAQNALGGEGETEGEKICEITEVISDNGAKIEEIDASSDAKMDIDRTGSADIIEESTGNAGVTEMTIEPTSPDATPTGSPTAAPIKNESTPSNDLPNHRSGLPENSPIKVPSENSENGSDTDKPNRKRKLEQPLDYNTMNEAILAQQRFGSSLRGSVPVPGLPFPYQLPFNHRRMSDGSSDDINSSSRLHPALNNHMASLAFQRMGGFPPNNEMMNHLSQMQGIINSLPKNNVTQESNSPPTQISSTPTLEQASSQTITEPEFKCDHCQLTFPDENFLKCHNEMHNNENNQPFECSKCKRVCRDSLEFFLHFRNNEHNI